MDEFTLDEKVQLMGLLSKKYPEPAQFYAMHAMHAIGALGTIATVARPQEFSFVRRWGLSPMVNVNNVSGHKAWVMVSPTPMTRIQSVGIEKAGHMDFSMVGEYKCQQSPVLNQDVCTFTLDTSNIYYTVFFECDTGWKMLHDNMKLNTSKADIHLVERQVLASVDSDFVPGHKVV
jgi:hypothetical protein